MRCGARPVMSSPANRTVPDAGRVSPVIARNDVVLPAPLAPSSATMPESGTVSERSRTACTPP